MTVNKIQPKWTRIIQTFLPIYSSPSLNSTGFFIILLNSKNKMKLMILKNCCLFNKCKAIQLCPFNSIYHINFLTVGTNCWHGSNVHLNWSIALWYDGNHSCSVLKCNLVNTEFWNSEDSTWVCVAWFNKTYLLIAEFVMFTFKLEY